MPEPVQHPSFHGEGGTLFVIHLKNLLLTILTLGIYSFWAKTNVRQYLYGQTSVGGDRFGYHGTGAELFRGWLKAMGILVVTFVISAVLSRTVHQAVGVIFLYAAGIIVFLPLALLGSRRYRLSRTSWRGIRFSFRGKFDALVGVFVPGILLTIFTLGLYYPFFHANVRRYFVNETRFGHAPFSFTGEGRGIFARHLLLYLLLPLTLGIYWFWHAAFRHRYYWGHTAFGGARFNSTLDGGDLLVFSLVNGLLLVFTAGIAYPWVQARTMTFMCERIGISDLAAFDAALQDARMADATGEGFLDALDVDIVGADLFGL
jgi:uncharacterized membrane protein YjgN (DUF898 family)